MSYQDEIVKWNPNDPNSKIHELTCSWLAGRNQEPDFVAQYVEIKRSDIPSERWHSSCGSCGANRW
jgi:hypothetical protein